MTRYIVRKYLAFADVVPYLDIDSLDAAAALGGDVVDRKCLNGGGIDAVLLNILLGGGHDLNCLGLRLRGLGGCCGLALGVLVLGAAGDREGCEGYYDELFHFAMGSVV